MVCAETKRYLGLKELANFAKAKRFFCLLISSLALIHGLSVVFIGVLYGVGGLSILAHAFISLFVIGGCIYVTRGKIANEASPAKKKNNIILIYILGFVLVSLLSTFSWQDFSENIRNTEKYKYFSNEFNNKEVER